MMQLIAVFALSYIGPIALMVSISMMFSSLFCLTTLYHPGITIARCNSAQTYNLEITLCLFNLLERGDGVEPEKKKASAARIRANKKYQAKAYDRIEFLVKKGRKEELKAHAAARGESMNAFINRAINMALEWDAQEAPE